MLLEMDAVRARQGGHIGLRCAEGTFDSRRARTASNAAAIVFSRNHLMGSGYEARTVVADHTIDSHVRRGRA